MGKGIRIIRSPRGPELSCRGWPQEAALRMLMNSLDPDVAELPRDLIACRSTRKILHSWESYDATVEALKNLKNNETLLVRSGRPVGVVETQQGAPRVLITSAGTEVALPASAVFNRHEQGDGHTLAEADPGSWTYVGTQQNLPLAFEVFDAVARKHFGGDLAGKLIVSGGMGAAGGALSLAAVMLGAAFLGIDVDGERIRRRIRAGYCDYCVNTLDESLRILKNAVRQKQGVSVGLVGNCGEVIPELASRGVVPDILTDQTSAHDLLNGYVPAGLNADDAGALRREHPHNYISRSRESLARHVEGMMALRNLGSIVFEFGNNLCAAAESAGVADAHSALPDFVESYLRPLLSTGLASTRWVALSGDTGDIHRFDNLALELFPADHSLTRWIQLARRHVRFQGLPARACWMDEETRLQMAAHLNRLVADGAIHAPFVGAYEHAENTLQASSRFPPDSIEGEQNSAVDGPMVEALVGAASGTSWASLESGPSYRQATIAVVADGTVNGASSLAHALRNDCARDFIRLSRP